MTPPPGSAALVALLIPAVAAAAPVSPARPGVYLSDSVELVLRADGSFAVQELGGSRQARGSYRTEGESLTFLSGDGDVGSTRFPLVCRIGVAFAGFTVASDQPRCRAFDGLSFRMVQ